VKLAPLPPILHPTFDSFLDKYCIRVLCTYYIECSVNPLFVIPTHIYLFPLDSPSFIHPQVLDNFQPGIPSISYYYFCLSIHYKKIIFVCYLSYAMRCFCTYFSYRISHAASSPFHYSIPAFICSISNSSLLLYSLTRPRNSAFCLLYYFIADFYPVIPAHIAVPLLVAQLLYYFNMWFLWPGFSNRHIRVGIWTVSYCSEIILR
jgi:hypothetical protein